MYLFNFWLCWVFNAVWAPSSFREQRPLSSGGAQAPHGSSISRRKAQAGGQEGPRGCSARTQQLQLPGSRAQARLRHTGLKAPWHVGSCGSGIEPRSSALAGRFSTTEPPRKAPSTVLYPTTLNLP